MREELNLVLGDGSFVSRGIVDRVLSGTFLRDAMSRALRIRILATGDRMAEGDNIFFLLFIVIVMGRGSVGAG